MADFESIQRLIVQKAYSCAERLITSRIEIENDSVDLMWLLAQVRQGQGRIEQALELMTQAHAKEPKRHDLLLWLGSVHEQAGQLKQAASCYQGVIRRKPQMAVAYSLLGNILKRRKLYDQALEAHGQAVGLCPKRAEFISNLATTLVACGQPAQAIRELKKALDIEPNNPDYHFNLGCAEQAFANYPHAIKAFQTALQLMPEHAPAQLNLGVCLKNAGRVEQAVSVLKKLCQQTPQDPEAHWNLGLSLLLTSDCSQGWQEYEWRTQIPSICIKKSDKPRWDGTMQPGKTLLLSHEQGLGDSIQFIRFAQEARSRCARIVFECPDKLVRLFSGIEYVDQWVTQTQHWQDYDLHTPLLSLPYTLGLSNERFVRQEPYLKPQQSLQENWRERLGDCDRLRIGISWQGNPAYQADQDRSIALTHFLPLMKHEHLQFFILQKHHGREQLQEHNNIEAIDLAPQLDNTDAFVDSAAVISQLDLVICSDSAIAHLAGALGVPVWLLLAKTPDWRWGLHGERTIWYQNMRLWRQETAGDWVHVFERLGSALTKLPKDGKLTYNQHLGQTDLQR